MNRRELLSALGVALAGCKALRYRPPDHAVLDDHEHATLAALADTFLPGGAGAPSARDVGAVRTLVEPAHGLLPYLAELVADLDQWCLATKLVAFQGLAPAARELALEQRMGLRGKALQSWYRPAYDGALALTQLAFVTHPLGAAYLGFPGPSAGYAPGTAAGAYTAREPRRTLVAGLRSRITVEGAGTIADVRTSLALERAPGADEAIRAQLRVVAPGGRGHVLDVRGPVTGVALPLAGGPAAGTWQLDVLGVTGDAELAAWALVLRTEQDDA